MAALASSAVLVVCVLVGFATWRERSERIEDAQAHAISLARAIEPYLRRLIERGGEYLAVRRRAIEAAGGPQGMSTESLDALFADRPLNDVVLRYVFLSDAEGNVIHGAGGGRWTALRTVSTRAFFLHHVGSLGRGLRVSPPLRSRIDSELRLPLSVRLDDEKGNFAGVLNTALEARHLSGYLASLGLPPGAAVHIVTDEGETLARHPFPPSDAERGKVMRTMKAFVEEEGTFRLASPVDGIDRVGAHRRIVGTSVRAVVAFEEQHVLAPWERNTRLRVGAGVVALAATALLTWLLMRYLNAARRASANLGSFRRAVDISGDLIYWVDEQGNVEYMNDAAARRRGEDPGRAQRPHLRDIFEHWTPEGWEATGRTLRRDGEVVFEATLRHSDGGTHPVQVSATYLDLEGHGFGFLICRDLTEVRAQQKQNRELSASLEQRVRERTAELAAANGELESFSYAVSHDLRAPLNHLQAYAGRLAECIDTDRQESLDMARRIVERSEYMRKLIDELLQLSRVNMKELACAEQDLTAMALEIDAEQRALQPRRTVETLVAPGLRVSADPVLLRTLMENLLSNAWKYSSRREAARIEVFAQEIDGERVFVVRDNGAGFDPRYSQRLFGAFQRLHSKDEFPGTGVGLATARRIVTRHGGRIWAESSVGAGATFRFTFGAP